MNSFGFTMQVTGIDTTGENYEDTLYEAGCNDALVLVQDGRLFLDFHRSGATFDDAVKSAASSIARAGGKVEEISPLPE
ncbi:MAG: hypothetical protein ACREFB_08795 [Stellaceae bacterium]